MKTNVIQCSQLLSWLLVLISCQKADEQLTVKAREMLKRQEYSNVIALLAPRRKSLQNAEVLNMLGYAYMETHQIDSAIACFNQAIKIDNQNYKYFYNRGNAFWQIGMPEEALKDFNRALELNANVYQIYLNRGATLAALGRHQEAIADFSRAAEMNNNDRNIFYNRAQSYIALKDLDKALTDLQKCITISPDYARAYYMLGLILYAKLPPQSKNNPQACEYLQKAIDLGMPEARDLFYEKCGQY
ncbi:MAG: tetratricopeptide repeat protein [Cytophagales bacterium]|nr:tetratricopeptide repeat protein [Cytophagales bacterium]